MNARKETILGKKGWHGAFIIPPPWLLQTQGQTNEQAEERQLKDAVSMERSKREKKRWKKSWERTGEKLTGRMDGWAGEGSHCLQLKPSNTEMQYGSI